MSQTLIDLDEDALAAAAELYGTTTKSDTVNTALREAAVRARRRAASNRLSDMAGAGDFDVLLDKRNYRQ